MAILRSLILIRKDAPLASCSSGATAKRDVKPAPVGVRSSCAGAVATIRWKSCGATAQAWNPPVTIPPMTAVAIQHVSKRFGQVAALDDISLSVAAGELFFLLGPSGCGKSTLLRIIAGLQEASSGRILFNDRDVTHLPTEKRNAVMCFQSYALWPHMSVRDNVGFGLETRGWTRERGRERVDEVLRLVQLERLAERKPNELSGGQQQRVALARALVVNPDCLLLDEPLSNLDAKLRLEMRGEIRRICKSAGFTTIYVTHDQREALSVADRIALLRDGKLAQVGTPEELYRRPTSSFVAQFVGQTNLIPATVIERGQDATRVQTPIGSLLAAVDGELPERIIASIRPEWLRVARPGDASRGNQFEAKVVETTFLGESSEHILLAGDHRLRMLCTPPMFHAPETVTVEVDPRDVVLLKE